MSFEPCAIQSSRTHHNNPIYWQIWHYQTTTNNYVWPVWCVNGYELSRLLQLDKYTYKVEMLIYKYEPFFIYYDARIFAGTIHTLLVIEML